MKRLIWALFFVTPYIHSQTRHTLDECQRLARENYPLIKRYALIDKSTEYSVANAAKAYLPQFTLVVQATYQNNVAMFPEQMTSIYEPFGMEMKGLNKDQYKIAMEMNQMIWDGGFTRTGKDILIAEGNVSVQSVEAELYVLRERINQLYFGILILDEQLRQNELLRELLQSNYHTVEAYLKNGIALTGDLDAIKAEQLSVSQQQTQIESTAEAYCRMLSVMTGKVIGDTDTFDKPEVSAGREPYNAVAYGTILSAAGNARPELRLFDAQSARLDAQERALKASTMPRLGVFLQGYYGNPGLNLFKDMTEDKWSWNYIAGLRLQWNFSAFYTKKGDLQKLSLARQQVDNQKEIFLYNNSLQQIQQQKAIAKMRKVMADDNEIIELRTSIRTASEAKFSNGTITIGELLRDITTENQALLNKSLHELEWLKNIYELKYTVNN
jgi:outer membrane protein TolC